MAYPESYADDPGVAAPRAAALMGWLGALTSLVLVAGLAYWVWDLATRDARAVPVVRAMEGPARVAPDDPGGFEAAHQGYAVNSIASETPDTPLSERIVLAPEPVGPAPSDSVRAVPRPQDAEADPDAVLRSAVENALGEVLGGVLGADEVSARPAPTGASDVRPPGLPPRPMPRPDLDVVTRTAPDDGFAEITRAAFIPVPAGPIDAAAIPPGTRLVQLGAFETREAAEARWSGLGARFEDYFAGKSQVVEAVDFDGESFYRLRAHGFGDLSEARSFCAVLLADLADCIPVLTR